MCGGVGYVFVGWCCGVVLEYGDQGNYCIEYQVFVDYVVDYVFLYVDGGGYV